MDSNIITFIVIPIAIISLFYITRKTRNKLAKPEYTDNNVQTPGKFEKVILWVIRIVAIFSALFALLGLIAGETEMGLVFLGLTLIMGGSVWLVKREYNMSYQENDEFFILNKKGKEYKVYYDDIVDWLPGHNEIEVYDKTKTDSKFIRVNVSIFQPVILLENIAKMTSAGRFPMESAMAPGDPNRVKELAHFLQSYGYVSVVESYL